MALEMMILGTTKSSLVNCKSIAYYANVRNQKSVKITTISLQRSVMFTELPTTTIAHAIQLAVAPVFLLTGVASILSVLTNRLGRIIDRSRFLHGKLLSLKGEKQDKEIHAELAVLTQRTRFINWAIGLCTACVLLIC